MKKIYETFTEIAEDFRDGDHWTHSLSEHENGEECFAWQHGVMEFGKWLDKCGVKIIQNPEIHKTLWEDVRTYKPTEFKNHELET